MKKKTAKSIVGTATEIFGLAASSAQCDFLLAEEKCQIGTGSPCINSVIFRARGTFMRGFNTLQRKMDFKLSRRYFAEYVLETLTTLHPEIRIPSLEMACQIFSFNQILESVFLHALSLNDSDEHSVISSEELRSAVNHLFPPSVAEVIDFQCTKAVERYSEKVPFRFRRIQSILRKLLFFIDHLSPDGSLYLAFFLRQNAMTAIELAVQAASEKRWNYHW